MTTGQRIAAKRKERELSQESLGAELGVSRQTVYKWESDTSLPEIEKLVALSRLFQVPVGWLLGVEEVPEATEFSEDQLKLLEELLGRYQRVEQAELSQGQRAQGEAVREPAAPAAVALGLGRPGGGLGRMERIQPSGPDGRAV